MFYSLIQLFSSVLLPPFTSSPPTPSSSLKSFAQAIKFLSQNYLPPSPNPPSSSFPLNSPSLSNSSPPLPNTLLNIHKPIKNTKLNFHTNNNYNKNSVPLSPTYPSPYSLLLSPNGRDPQPTPGIALNSFPSSHSPQFPSSHPQFLPAYSYPPSSPSSTTSPPPLLPSLIIFLNTLLRITLS